ncbi:hypothetical protein S245_061036, partial [Arachis hypogaea]
ISSTSTNPTPHFGGIEHWEDQVQSFRFGYQVYYYKFAVILFMVNFCHKPIKTK